MRLANLWIVGYVALAEEVPKTDNRAELCASGDSKCNERLQGWLEMFETDNKKRDPQPQQGATTARDPAEKTDNKDSNFQSANPTDENPSRTAPIWATNPWATEDPRRFADAGDFSGRPNKNQNRMMPNYNDPRIFNNMGHSSIPEGTEPFPWGFQSAKSNDPWELQGAAMPPWMFQSAPELQSAFPPPWFQSSAPAPELQGASSMPSWVFESSGPAPELQSAFPPPWFQSSARAPEFQGASSMPSWVFESSGPTFESMKSGPFPYSWASKDSPGMLPWEFQSMGRQSKMNQWPDSWDFQSRSNQWPDSWDFQSRSSQWPDSWDFQSRSSQWPDSWDFQARSSQWPDSWDFQARSNPYDLNAAGPIPDGPVSYGHHHGKRVGKRMLMDAAGKRMMMDYDRMYDRPMMGGSPFNTIGNNPIGSVIGGGYGNDFIGGRYEGRGNDRFESEHDRHRHHDHDHDHDDHDHSRYGSGYDRNRYSGNRPSFGVPF